MKNLGKKFEENWKKSVPENMFCYRFRDSGSTYYGGNANLRFSTSNIADCMIQDPFTGLHLIELKNHKGKSIPLGCILGKQKKDGSYAKSKQIKDLLDASKFAGVLCHIIVFFSDVERCFSISIEDFVKFVNEEERQSIPISYFEENGIEIGVSKLKTNYRFDVTKWLVEF